MHREAENIIKIMSIVYGSHSEGSECKESNKQQIAYVFSALSAHTVINMVVQETQEFITTDIDNLEHNLSQPHSFPLFVCLSAVDKENVKLRV